MSGNKRIPVPVSFMVVISAVIALFIFFGAWAVSVDAANNQRELSFAVGNSTSFGINPLASQADNRISADEEQVGNSVADTWWGQSLLIACPLH